MLGDEFSVHPNASELVGALKAEADFLSLEIGGDGDLTLIGERLVLLDRVAFPEDIARHRHGFPARWLRQFLPKALRRGNLEMPGAIERNIGIPHPIELVERRTLGKKGRKLE